MVYLVCAAAFLIGLLLSFINYRITAALEAKRPNSVAVSFVPRQVINIAYIVSLYFFSSKTGYSMIGLLLCGAIGLSVGSVFLTAKLVKPSENAVSNENKKEDETNG